MTVADLREQLNKVDEEIDKVDEEIKEIKSEICDHYCKHTEKWKAGEDIEEICDKCPLNRL